MGLNVKEFLRLVEDFVDMIGMQMKDFQDIYEVTENLGELKVASCSPPVSDNDLSSPFSDTGVHPSSSPRGMEVHRDSVTHVSLQSP